MTTRLPLLLLFCFAVMTTRAAELNVFAAASLSDALREIAPEYEARTGDKLVLNLGASSTLALQIKNGAPADVFFSADEAKMEDLAKAGLLAADTRRRVLSNTLVIVVRAEGGVFAGPEDLTLPAVRRIALAEPQTVPAGIYAREWLTRAKLWEKLLPRVVPTENVRACLAAVEAGNVDAGIVYKTDALISKNVKVACEAVGAVVPPISYPLAVLKNAKHDEAARRLTTYLAGPDARAVFIKFGFLPAR